MLTTCRSPLAATAGLRRPWLALTCLELDLSLVANNRPLFVFFIDVAFFCFASWLVCRRFFSLTARFVVSLFCSALFFVALFACSLWGA